MSKEGVVSIIAKETADWEKKISLVIFMDGVCASKPSLEYLKIESKVRAAIRSQLIQDKESMQDQIFRGFSKQISLASGPINSPIEEHSLNCKPN